jgi:hypothetical protein
MGRATTCSHRCEQFEEEHLRVLHCLPPARGGALNVGADSCC